MMEFNGIHIDISREDFLKQASKTRDWMMFSTVAGLTREINHIKENGCSWARNYTRKRSLKEIMIILGVASSFGIIGGASAVFMVMKFWP